MTIARVDRRSQRSPARSGATGTGQRTDASVLRRQDSAAGAASSRWPSSRHWSPTSPPSTSIRSTATST
ncbi:hypothetical protein ACRAWF_41355 [Streptomyces sp. L7]